ncbi:MAG: hypothetical protein ACLTTH_08720 [Holdemanella porci]
MYYKRNNKRLSVSGRGDYMSTSDFIIQYYTNLDACRKFFLRHQMAYWLLLRKVWLYSLLFHEN